MCEGLSSVASSSVASPGKPERVMRESVMMRTLSVGLALTVATLLGACQSTPTSQQEGKSTNDAQQALVDRPKLLENWYLVSREPPTFYPKGLPEDAPTEGGHGEWVEARNRTVRWFVPYGGVGELSIEQLRKEAFDWQRQVHKIQQRRKREENPVSYAGEMLAKTAVVGTGVALLGSGALVGAVPHSDSPVLLLLDDLWEAASQ